MANVLDLLAQLSGRSRAAMNLPAVQDLMNLAQTPPFIPAPAIGPMAPPPSLPVPPVRTQPIPAPGEPGAQSLAFPPEAPLDYNAILARAGQTAGAIMGPPPAPERAPGFLQGLLQALQQGVQAGLTNDPGAALAEFRRQEFLKQRDKELAAREDRAEGRRLTAQIYTGEVANERAERRETRREQRDEERDLQNYLRDQQRILGDQVFRANEAQLQRIWEEKREGMRAEAAAKTAQEKAEADRKQDIRNQANTLFDDFKETGISRSQAIRFAQHEILDAPLSAADRKVYDRKIAPVRQGNPTEGAKDKLARFEILKGQLEAARARGDDVAERGILKKLDDMAAKMPSYIETGYDDEGETPYARVREPGPKKGTPSTARQMGIKPVEGMRFDLSGRGPAPGAESQTRAASRKKLVANGYSDAEATRELDRLGVK